MTTQHPATKPPGTLARLGYVARDQLRIDRTGIRPVAGASWQMHAAAWLAIVILFVAGWGRGTVRAVEVLLGGPTPAVHVTAPDVAGALHRIAFNVAICVVAIAVMVAFRVYARSPRPRVAWHASWQTYFVATFGTALGFATLAAVSLVFQLPQNRYPTPTTDGPIAMLYVVVTSAMAGPTEELALLGVVVVALRAVGYPWWLVATVAVIVRVPFHTYYGWGTIGPTVWVLLIVALYRRTGALGAIVLAHASFNALNYLPLEVGGLIKAAAVLAGAYLTARYIVDGLAAQRRADAIA